MAVHDVALAVDDGVADPLTAAVEVTTTGTVAGQVTIRLPVDPSVDLSGDIIVFATTATEVDGPVELIPARLDGDHLIVTTTHFSFFQGWFTTAHTVGEILRSLVDGVTGHVTAEASAPSCDNEEEVRARGLEITSDNTDVVYWCLGSGPDGAYLRVVNNRRYPLLLSHTVGLTPTAQAHTGVDLAAALGQALVADRTVALFPRDEVTFAVDTTVGQTERVVTEFDGVGNSLAQLQTGIDLAVAFLSRFGLGPHTDESAPFTLLVAVVGAGPCVAALEAGHVGDVWAGCFDAAIFEDVLGLAAGLVLAATLSYTSTVSFFRTTLNAAGDLIVGRDRYEIALVRTTAGDVDLAQLLAAPIPDICGHGAGTLRDGELPGVPDGQGGVWIDLDMQTTAFGDLTGDNVGDAAAIMSCSAGGVGFPTPVQVWASGPTPLATVRLHDYGPDEATDTRVAVGVSIDGGLLTVDWLTARDADASCCPSLPVRGQFRVHADGTVDLVDLTLFDETAALDAIDAAMRAGSRAVAGPHLADGAAHLIVDGQPSSSTIRRPCDVNLFSDGYPTSGAFGYFRADRYCEVVDPSGAVVGLLGLDAVGSIPDVVWQAVGYRAGGPRR